MDNATIKKAAKSAHLVFVKNNWTYHDSDSPPSVGRLEEVIKGLIESANNLDPEPGEDCFAASGRIRVQRDIFDVDSSGFDEEISILLELGTDWE